MGDGSKAYGAGIVMNAAGGNSLKHGLMQHEMDRLHVVAGHRGRRCPSHLKQDGSEFSMGQAFT
jgi:hypothetical protein